eukprot:Hpha_TRINITY_DN16753_c2_g5::TRINITY_DN16753_c2_g5_i1::g.77691::m.77691
MACCRKQDKPKPLPPDNDRRIHSGTKGRSRVTSEPEPDMGTLTAGVLVVSYGKTMFRLKNLEFMQRTISDLRKLLSAQTGIPPEQVRLQHIASEGQATDITAAPSVSLYTAGLRAGDKVELTQQASLVVLADAGDGSATTALRLHGVDPNTATVQQLRQVVARRLDASTGDVVLFDSRGAILQDGDGEGATLERAGLSRGDTIRARKGAPGSGTGGGGGGGAGAGGARRQTPAPYPTPADRGRSRSGVSPSAVQVASSWPAGCGVSGAVEGLLLVTDGLWTTDGALCRGAAAPPRSGGVVAQNCTTTLPLPPLRPEANIRDLRKVVTELLGVPPRSQILFCGGRPLPAAGGAGDLEMLRNRGIVNDSELQLAVDRSTPGGGMPSSAPPIATSHPSGRTEAAPVCVHCVLVRPGPWDVTGEWRPQFCQYSWAVSELINNVAQDAGEDPGLGAVYLNGRELPENDLIADTSLRDGSACLLVFRTTLDVSVEIQTPSGEVQTALLKGVPRRATVGELCRRAAVAAGVGAGIGFSCRLDEAPLPLDAGLREVGVGHGDTVVCQVLDGSASGTPLRSYPLLHHREPSTGGRWGQHSSGGDSPAAPRQLYTNVYNGGVTTTEHSTYVPVPAPFLKGLKGRSSSPPMFAAASFDPVVQESVPRPPGTPPRCRISPVRRPSPWTQHR